jgi:hypothetical protein
MNIAEFWVEVKKQYDLLKDEYDFVGVRFEDKSRSINEMCECSRHNTNRNDEREFPVYGTPEYEDMEILNGTSAWDLSLQSVYRIASYQNKTNDCKNHFLSDHCYIIVGDEKSYEENLDENEIVIVDAKVVAKIF